jgi:hypothetical protein
LNLLKNIKKIAREFLLNRHYSIDDHAPEFTKPFITIVIKIFGKSGNSPNTRWKISLCREQSTNDCNRFPRILPDNDVHGNQWRVRYPVSNAATIPLLRLRTFRSDILQEGLSTSEYNDCGLFQVSGTNNMFAVAKV